MGSVTYGVGAKLVGSKVKEVWETGKTEKQTIETHLDRDKDISLILSNVESHWRNRSKKGTCFDIALKQSFRLTHLESLAEGAR